MFRKLTIALLLISLFFTGTNEPAPVLLLVSDKVQQNHALADASKRGIEIIYLQTEEMSLKDILSRIKRRLAGRKAASIGFAVHDFGEGKFYLTGSQTISLGSTLRNKTQQQFWQDLGEFIAEEGRIDLFTCDLARNEAGMMLVNELQKLSGRKVAASDNKTGNPEAGGDWVLETADLDIKDIYFNANRLSSYQGLLTSHERKIITDSYYMGYSIDSSGDKLIAEDEASVFIFSRNRGGVNNWGLEKELEFSLPLGQANFSVSISGDVAVAADQSYLDSGRAFVFYKDKGGTNNWGEQRVLVGSNIGNGDYFGSSVSVDGDDFIAGAYKDAGATSNSGSAFIFSKDKWGPDNWGQTAKLIASDGASGDQFGYCVDISGDYAIVGAMNKDNGSDENAGAAYIFARNPSTGDWAEVQKLVPTAAGAQDLYGWTVAISGDDAFVASPWPKTVCYFKRNSGTGLWEEIQSLVPSDSPSGDHFGYSIDVEGDRLIVGANRDNDEGNFAGAAYYFLKNPVSGLWEEVEKITASDADVDDKFGVSVAITTDRVFAAADQDDDYDIDSGAVYVYTRSMLPGVRVHSATGGNTDKDGFTYVQDGGSLTITAQHEPLYLFSHWTGDASGSANPLTLNNITSDLEITPVFAINPAAMATLNVDFNHLGNGESYCIFGPSEFNGGNPVLDRVADYSGQVPPGQYTVIFDLPANEQVAMSSSYLTIYPPDGAQGDLSAGNVETVVGNCSIKEFDVVVNSASNGHTNRDGTTTVDYGDSLTITSIPDANYKFSSWSGTVNNTDNPLTINNIRRDYNVTPSFQRETGMLTINFTPQSSGATYSISGPADFNGGSPLTGQTGNYSQTVPTGSYTVAFDEVIDHDLSLTTSSFVISSNQVTGIIVDEGIETITANYSLKLYDVIVNAAPLGHTDHDGVNTVTYGDDLTINVTPDYGARFLSWTGDFSNSANPLEITNITRDYLVTPQFEKKKGSLRVFLEGTEKGRWRLVGKQQWLRSGAIVNNLHFGDVTVETLPVAGFRRPRNKVVTIREEVTRDVSLVYTPFDQAPIMHYFTATPIEVSKGGEVRLAWDAEGSNRVVITPDVGEFDQDVGRAIVKLEKTTTFTIRAKNADRSTLATVTAHVAPKLEILEFSADKPLLNLEDKALLRWHVRGGEKIVLLNKRDKASWDLGSQGELEVTPAETSSYQLTASSASGKHVSKIVKIVATKDAVINSFTTSVIEVMPGKPARLCWNVAGADRVEITPDVGEVGAAGEVQVSPQNTTTYTLRAWAGERQSQCEQTITVISKAPDLSLKLLGVTWQDVDVKKPLVGEITIVTALLNNQGTAEAKDVKVSLETENGSCNWVDIEKIAPGEEEKIELPWCAHIAGRHQLQLAADPGNNIGELLETNNSILMKLRVGKVKGADLIIDNVSVELDKNNSRAKVSLTILNVGNKACGSFQYRAFLTKGPQQSLEKALAVVVDDYLDGLEAGGIVTISRFVELNKTTRRIFLKGKVDVHGAIVEENKENNEIVRRMK